MAQRPNFPPPPGFKNPSNTWARSRPFVASAVVKFILKIGGKNRRLEEAAVARGKRIIKSSIKVINLVRGGKTLCELFSV
jgi:hypothetical protein